MTAYHDLIGQVANRHGLSPKLLEAQVVVESSGRTDAFRFEDGIWRQIQSGALKLKAKMPDPQVPRRMAASYGLLQVLYVTACDYGFDGPPEMLFVPERGLTFGALHLASLLKWTGGDYTRAFAAYNGGKAQNVTPPYRNQAYADKVFHVSDLG